MSDVCKTDLNNGNLMWCIEHGRYGDSQCYRLDYDASSAQMLHYGITCIAYHQHTCSACIADNETTTSLLPAVTPSEKWFGLNPIRAAGKLLHPIASRLTASLSAPVLFRLPNISRPLSLPCVVSL